MTAMNVAQATAHVAVRSKVSRIAVIAVIRTFLNYFLDRDIDEARKRQRESTELQGA